MLERLDCMKIVLGKNKTAPFIMVENSDGKRWLLPFRHMKTALEIYEPSGIKGKALKKALPLPGVANTCNKLGLCTCCEVILDEELKKLLDRLYNKYEYAVFCGTPSTDQKLTIQIFNNSEILGYCKIGSSKRIASLFAHEKSILDILEKSNVENVPRCKGIFPIGQVASVFVQTTEKKVGSVTEHSFGLKHNEFLKTIYEKTKETVMFEKTDLYASLMYLKENINYVKSEFKPSVKNALDGALLSYREKNVIWGVCHRDFTPWNTCVVDSKLFVFDFEYALRYAPKEIDRWHFYTQTCLYERNMSPEAIASEFRQKYIRNKGDIEMYLLDNISMYIQRGEIEDIEIANKKAEILSRINTD